MENEHFGLIDKDRKFLNNVHVVMKKLNDCI